MKLEDIDKKNIYKVPERYFDELPMKIQAKIEKQSATREHALNWNLWWKIAVPAMAVVLFFVLIKTPETARPQTPEELLAQVSANDVIAYLELTDISTDEILEEIDIAAIEMDFAEDPIMGLQFEDDDIELLLDDYGIDEETL